MSENSNSKENGGGNAASAVFIFIYLVALSVATVHGIIKFWPNTPIPEVVKTSYFGVPLTVSGEVLLLLITFLTGTLGGLLHAIRSYFFYVSKKEFNKDFLTWYLYKPITGSFIAVIFYWVVRGGFFSPGTSIEGASPYGFAALAGLVGMFSDQAVEKLKQVAENILAKPPRLD